MDYSQKLATALGMFLAIIVLCTGSALLSYIYGKNNGYDAGYQAAQNVSLSQTYEEGKDEGYQAGYKAGHASGLSEGATDNNPRNPTYLEMQGFLDQDATSSKTYIKDEYVCTDFSAAVNNNADALGIRCAIVDIFYPKGYGHTIVAFETTDRGLIFVEPQFDHEVNLIIGKSYSQTNNYSPPPEDDIIKRFLVIW